MLKPLNKNYALAKISFIAFAFISAIQVNAGVTHSVQQTAVTLQPGNYEIRGQGDIILNRGGGVNVSGHFKTGIIEDMLDAEAFIGTGKTDFKLGATAKFNLLPDIPGQVGLAFIGGIGFINDDYKGHGNDSIKVINLGAITSKKVEASFGSVSPYGGIQVELLFKDGDNDAPITGIVGAEWALNGLNPWVFLSELDIDINDSVFLLAAGGAYRF